MTTDGSTDCYDNYEVITQAPNSSNGSPGDHHNQQNENYHSDMILNYDTANRPDTDLDDENNPNFIEYRPIGDILRICQVNVEGLSPDKVEFLSKLSSQKQTDVLIIQETHKSDDDSLMRTGMIRNFKLVDSINHKKYGIATYAKTSIRDLTVTTKIDIDNIAVLVVKINGVSVMNIYKPPRIRWSFDLPTFEHPAVYMGDFNSHHELWNYAENDANGETLIDWALNNELHLTFDAKDPQTFQSRNWDGVYNPDLCFVSTDENGNALPAIRSVYHCFSRSQHRTVFLEVGIQIPMIHSVPLPRWNFKKANWIQFQESVDKNVRWFKPQLENFKRFSGVITAAAKRSIPRGYRKNYIPTWSPECENLWTEYQSTGDIETGTKILRTLNKERKERWKTMVENLDFKHSSRKAWDLLKKLSGETLNVNTAVTVNPNLIAHRLISASKMTVKRELANRIKRQLKSTKKKIRESPFGGNVTLNELNTAIETLKPGKASGVDGLFSEFFVHLGENARKWLAKFYSRCYCNPKFPKTWKMALVRAALKPGKPKDEAESYRPISLLCIAFNLLERIVYNRIAELVHKHIPIDQAGFTPNRSCCDQVLALTTHIEAGLQDKKKTAVVLVDLSSAFDTVWKNALILKLAKIIKCKKTINLVTAMLSNRMFQVSIGGRKSRTRRLNSGLAQGGVLSPLLFILYISDLPRTMSRKFIFADDLALAIQYGYDELSEKFAVAALNKDLDKLAEYYAAQRLRANPTKTEVSTFHLSNRNANRTISVTFCGKPVKYNPTPKYLGMKLDRSLTYKPHLHGLRMKLKTRCNIIQKLAGSSWGSSAATLRTSALSLVYSTAEYCCPVWSHSTHVKKVDTTINSCLRLITGTIKSTPLLWLPVLANILPSSIRRNGALAREAKKIYSNLDLPTYGLDEPNRRSTGVSETTLAEDK